MKSNTIGKLLINFFPFLIITIFSIIYSLFSLFFLPFFLIIDLLLNIKRKDLSFFLFCRYILPFSLLFKKTNNFYIYNSFIIKLKNIFKKISKNIKDNFSDNISKNISNNIDVIKENIFIFSTSAGELKTISETIEKNKTYEKYNIIFFYTSITAKEFSKNINFPNLNFYLYPDNPIFNFIYFIKYKPIKIFFFESEIWPGTLIFSKLFKAKSYFIQGKFPHNNFITPLYSFFILNLFDIIIPQDNEENLKILKIKKYIPIFFKLESPINFKLLNDYKKYLNKYDLDKNNIDKDNLNKNNLNNEEKEEENIKKEFFLNEILLNEFIFITFASTHKSDEPFFFNLVKFLNENLEFNNIIYLFVPRHPERSDSIINEFNKNFNKNTLNYNFSLIKLSELKSFSEYIENFHSQNKEIVYKAKSDLENIVKNYNIRPIIICDKFNILKNIYNLSKITFMGATFFWHGGGHNILEPLISGNILICGPYLSNLKDIFQKISEKTGICAIFKPDDLNKFIEKKFLKRKIIYSKNTVYLNNYNELLNFIINNLKKDKNDIIKSILDIFKFFEEENKSIIEKLKNIFS